MSKLSETLCGALSFQSGTNAGRTEAIERASKASKNVAMPMIMRVLTCHHDIGSRSMRARIWSAVNCCEAVDRSVTDTFLCASNSASVPLSLSLTTSATAGLLSHRTDLYAICARSRPLLIYSQKHVLEQKRAKV